MRPEERSQLPRKPAELRIGIRRQGDSEIFDELLNKYWRQLFGVSATAQPFRATPKARNQQREVSIKFR